MSLYTKHSKGLLDGTEEVTVVGATAAGANIVTMFRLVNMDTESITFTLRIKDDRKLGEDDEYLNVLPDTTLESGEYISYTGPMICLPGFTTLVIELASSVTTNQPHFQAIYVEES